MSTETPSAQDDADRLRRTIKILRVLSGGRQVHRTPCIRSGWPCTGDFG